jgi:ABC-type Mn2+/Zn2+ transport system permease subunit
VGAGLLSNLSKLALLTAHEDMAHVCGVPVRRYNYLFVVVLTFAVAITIRLLGIILVTALIVIPPAAARNVSRNLRQQIVSSIVLGLVSSVGGTLLSFQLDVPCGPAIVLTSTLLFVFSLAFPRRA